MAKEKVLVAGSLVLDIVAAVDDGADTRMLFAEGKQTELKGVEMYLGGEVGNMGIALSKLGVPVTLVSKVGDDIGGRIIRDFLKSFPVSAAVKTVKNLKSTVSVCLTVPGKDKITFHKRGASQTFTPDDIDETLLRQVDLFHFGYPPTMETLYDGEGKQLLGMLQKAKNAGATTSIDMSLPSLASAAGQINWRPILKKILPYVDIFLPSLEESIFLWDRDRYIRLVEQAGNGNMVDWLTDGDACALAENLLEFGAKIVLLKCGKKGMYLRTAELPDSMGRAQPDLRKWGRRELWEAPCDVQNIHSTTGAGDTAIAGFIAAYLNGCNPEQTLQIASYTAARCIEGYDTSGSLGNLKETITQCAQYKKMTIPLDMKKWRPGGRTGLWVGNHDSTRTDTL